MLPTMKIYTDVFSNDRMLSDIYPIEEVFNGTIYQVKPRYVCKTVSADIISGDGEDSSESANTIMVIDVIDMENLQECSLSKGDFHKRTKTYLKCLRDYLATNSPERVESFMKNIQDFVKYILTVFDQCQFYLGSSVDSTANMAILLTNETNDYIIYFIKDGLKEENI